MKNSYDFGAYFEIEYTDKHNNTAIRGNFDKFDGLSSALTIELLEVKKEFSVTGIKQIFFDSAVRKEDYKEISRVIAIISEGYYPDTIESLVAKEILRNFENIDLTKQKMALCFLERYVMSPEEVRKFHHSFLNKDIPKPFGEHNEKLVDPNDRAFTRFTK